MSGVCLLLALFAVGVGALALRQRIFGFVGLAPFVGVGIAAVLGRPASEVVDVRPTVVVDLWIVLLAGVVAMTAAAVLLFGWVEDLSAAPATPASPVAGPRRPRIR